MSARIPARVLLSHPLGWIASGFGVGLAPKAAGTLGSIVALGPWLFVLARLQLHVYVAVLVLAFAIGVWASAWVIRRTGIEDPGVVVWDEFVGMWIALFPLVGLESWDWRTWVAGFVLFRVFDIWKPWPVRWADREVHGGLGAMLDDVLAGAMALIVLQAGLWLAMHYFGYGADFGLCCEVSWPWAW